MPASISNTPIELLADQFSQLKPKEQAQALTMACIRMFRKIDPDEFIVYMWGTREQKTSGELISNLNAFVDRFNKIGYWVATEVCGKVDIRARALSLEHFIRVAKVTPAPSQRRSDWLRPRTHATSRGDSCHGGRRFPPPHSTASACKTTTTPSPSCRACTPSPSSG